MASILSTGLLVLLGSSTVASADDADVPVKRAGGKDLGLIELVGGDGDDTELIGIDYRVQDGRLHGVGNGGGVFVLSLATAVGTFISELTVALDGTRFGVDFNPPPTGSAS
jgi:hypothetical protein